MPRTALATDGNPQSHMPYSPAVRAGDLVLVSGQASVDDTGQIVNDTLAGELARSMANVERILTTVGGSMDDVVSVRCYLGREEDRAEFNRLYTQYFSQPYPTRTTISGCLGDLKFEIDVIAHIPAGRAGS